MLKLDPKISAGNILTIVAIVGSLLGMYVDFEKRLTFVETVQANQTSTEREHYLSIINDIRELRTDVKKLLEKFGAVK